MGPWVILSVVLCKVRVAGSTFFTPTQIKKSVVQGLQNRIALLITNKDEAPEGISSSNGRIEAEHVETSIDVARPLRHQAPFEGWVHRMPQRSSGPKLTAECILVIFDGAAGIRMSKES